MKRTPARGAGERARGPLYCTYCSAGKHPAATPMPAVRRYLSPRIRLVHRMSRRAGVPFAILSGEFGLLGPYEKIPHYDHLLAMEEVAALLSRVASYLSRRGIRSVRFFHEPLKTHPRLRPYLAVISRACRQAGARLILSELTPQGVLGNRRHGTR